MSRCFSAKAANSLRAAAERIAEFAAKKTSASSLIGLLAGGSGGEVGFPPGGFDGEVLEEVVGETLGDRVCEIVGETVAEIVGLVVALRQTRKALW